MKQIMKGILSVLLVVSVVFLGFLIYGNYTENKKPDTPPVVATPSPTPTPAATPKPTPEPDKLTELSLAVLGDIVCHEGLNKEARQADGSYNYTPIFSGAANAVKAADYAICTMETTFPENAAYSGYPMFKSPPALASALKNLGFDMINTASNHSMDGLKNGLNNTLNILEQNGLEHIGTYRSQEERNKNNGIVQKEINGISIAFLSFTYGTNGIPLDGFEYAVNVFYNDYVTTLRDINFDLLKSDMAAARALNTDMIIVQMHWGNEYATKPVDYQVQLADFLFKEGADLVLGGHVHVPEPMEMRHVVDNEGKEKTGFIVYCLGNLISCQNDRYTNLTAALDIKIEKNLTKGETYLKSVSYDPLFMVDLSDYGIKADWNYRLWDLHAAISSYESGDNLGVINDGLYGKLKAGLTDIYSIMDPKFDAVNGGVDALQWAKEN
ncbi:MAG: CapA family protein [Oscillospiraceae bacterium]